MQKKIFTCLTALWIIFILTHSMRTAAQSSTDSSIFAELLNKIFTSLSRDDCQHIVRKAAHMTEFFILSVFLVLSFGNTFWQNKFAILFISLAVACTDELIQLFVEGRSGEVIDIWIDFIGALIGFIICFTVSKIKKR